MKKIFVVILLVIMAGALYAQVPQKNYFKDLLKDTTYVPDSLLVYPLKGTCKISESGFIQFKNVEFWVHDANGKEIYYASVSMRTQGSTPDPVKDAETFFFSIDREYRRYMKLNGDHASRKALDKNINRPEGYHELIE